MTKVNFNLGIRSKCTKINLLSNGLIGIVGTRYDPRGEVLDFPNVGVLKNQMA